MKSGPAGSRPSKPKRLHSASCCKRHQPLRPRTGLEHRVAAVVVGDRRLDGRLPLRHVVGGEHAAMAAARGIHDLLRAAELVDRLGDEALAPGLAGALDLGLAVAAVLRLAQDALVGVGHLRIGEMRAGLRHLAARQIDRRRGRPVLAGTGPSRCRWWRRCARPADSRCAHSRSRATARRRCASCRSRAAASSRCRTCRECRPRAGRCRAPDRGRACRGNARWSRRPAPTPARRSPPACRAARRRGSPARRRPAR